MRVMAWPAFSNREWNPYNSLLYGAIQKKGVEVIEFDGRISADFRGIDILHIHWPDLFLKRRFRLQAALACASLLLIMKRARDAGTRVVWTAHNLQSHENLYPWIEKTFWSLFVRELDGVISMSTGGLAQTRKLRLGAREIPCAVIPHGHYRGTYPDLTDRAAARERFGIPSTTLVFGQFGLIRPYKGLEKLVNSWTAWRERPEDSLLLIAGHPSDKRLDEFLTLHASQPEGIQYHPGSIDAGDFQYFFRASDVIVLPYQKILNSGAALLALSFNKPVVLPRTEALAELRDQVGPDWVYLYDGEFDTSVLKEAARWLGKRTAPTVAPMDCYDWDLIAGKTIAFYSSLAVRS
jgi:glycosyltransferase involved in cell wall biosynthesis